MSDAATRDLRQAVLTLAETVGADVALATSIRPTAAATQADTSAELPRLATGGATTGSAETFRLNRLLASGGMGEIHTAWQESLAREVAVKRSRKQDPAARAQFLAEARVTGCLEHANIVPVHVLGQSETGEPLLAMKLVRGAAWSTLLHQPPRALDLEDHLRVLIAVCNALAFAHRAGILHRDVKPANVMVGELGEVFVMDWGLAVGLDTDTCARHGLLPAALAEAPAGTPAYMAPEQARGDGRALGPWTDVYLLGACLHEVLTRRPRHDATGATPVDEALRSAVLSPPVSYAASVPRELAELANRATARDPQQRMHSAEAFRDAIAAFLKHQAAHGLLDQGERLAGELGALVASRGSDRAVHGLHAESSFALRQALTLWPEAPGAAAALMNAHRHLLLHALQHDDLALAERVLPDVEDPDATARVGALRDRLARGEAELDTLRARARRSDWAALHAPVGIIFLASGVLGALGMLVTGMLRASGVTSALVLGGLWLVLAAGFGMLALHALRRVAVPDSLVSPRVLGLWASVALACLVAGMVNHLHGQPPLHDSSYTALLLGVGFAAMALETRRWLLLPAALFFAGSLVMAATSTASQRIYVFALLWLIGIGGTGAAVRGGARLDAEEAGASKQ